MAAPAVTQEKLLEWCAGVDLWTVMKALRRPWQRMPGERLHPAQRQAPVLLCPGSFLLKQAGTRARPALSASETERTKDEEKLLGSARVAWPGSGGSGGPCLLCPDSFIL